MKFTKEDCKIIHLALYDFYKLLNKTKIGIQGCFDKEDRTKHKDEIVKLIRITKRSRELKETFKKLMRK